MLIKWFSWAEEEDDSTSTLGASLSCNVLPTVHNYKMDHHCKRGQMFSLCSLCAELSEFLSDALMFRRSRSKLQHHFQSCNAIDQGLKNDTCWVALVPFRNDVQFFTMELIELVPNSIFFGLQHIPVPETLIRLLHLAPLTRSWHDLLLLRTIINLMLPLFCNYL